jgi:hypothetical protein
LNYQHEILFTDQKLKFKKNETITNVVRQTRSATLKLNETTETTETTETKQEEIKIENKTEKKKKKKRTRPLSTSEKINSWIDNLRVHMNEREQYRYLLNQLGKYQMNILLFV